MSVTEADTGSRPGGLRRRVVLLAESAGLAAVLGHLLGPGDRLSRLDSLRDLARSRLLEGADVVVLDLPDSHQRAAVRLVRRRFRGPLVILAGEGKDPSRSDLDYACTLLTRPFSVEELGAALAGRGWPPARAAGAAPVRATAPPPGRRNLVDRAQRLLIAVVEGWQSRRQVRAAGIAALALVAFTAAFALAAQGRCNPDCEVFGPEFSPAPTIAPSESRGPSPITDPKHPTTTIMATAPTFSPTTRGFRAISGRRPARTTTTTRPLATTTSRKPPTSRPATTRPPNTQTTAPPTTGPTTTQPSATTPTTTVGP